MTENSLRKEIRGAIKRLFKSDDGQKVLGYLCDYSKVFQTTFTGDPLTSAYNEGVRSVILHLLHEAGHEPVLDELAKHNQRKVTTWKMKQRTK